MISYLKNRLEEKRKRLEKIKQEERRKTEELEEAIRLNEAYPCYEFLLETLKKITAGEIVLATHDFNRFRRSGREIEIYKADSLFDIEVRNGTKQIIDIRYTNRSGFVKFDTKMKVQSNWATMDLSESPMIQEITESIKKIHQGLCYKKNFDERLDILKKEANKNRLRKELRVSNDGTNG